MTGCLTVSMVARMMYLEQKQGSADVIIETLAALLDEILISAKSVNLKKVVQQVIALKSVKLILPETLSLVVLL